MTSRAAPKRRGSSSTENIQYVERAHGCSTKRLHALEAPPPRGVGVGRRRLASTKAAELLELGDAERGLEVRER